ncbi:MAG: class I SAM-dependent methyltransferase [Candidatus Dormibacteria bacterium]
MLARTPLPPEFVEWNRRWGAPWGMPAASGLSLGERLASDRRSEFGPFAFQANNTTREFEYPWAFQATPLRAGMRAVELGASLTGFQFVLAQAGLEVLGVDPGDASTGAQDNALNAENHALLNAAFETSVSLHQERLENVSLPASSIDRVFCISTLEHIHPADLPSLLAEIWRILRPGGMLVLTIDLFLDLHPFATARENEWGTNIDIGNFIQESRLQLVQGVPAELYGHPLFRAHRVESMLPSLVIGRGHPVVVQALVLEKPGDPPPL